jgi:DNA helicase II / ATP-dependent DNA helicase PcrA
MNHWDTIRLKARHNREIVLKETDEDSSSEAMLHAVAKLTGIASQGLPAKCSLLYNSVATLHSEMVWFNQELENWEQIFNQFHEYAHYWLHGENFICGIEDINSEATEDAIKLGSQRVDGYGPHERRELEANVFAREFLLPGNELRKWFLNGENAAQIAEKTEMPEGMVVHCLLRALLGTELQEIKPKKPKDKIDERKDVNQVNAARAGEEEFDKNCREKVILVDAGPGTGKTRTLIKRI